MTDDRRTEIARELRDRLGIDVDDPTLAFDASPEGTRQEEQAARAAEAAAPLVTILRQQAQARSSVHREFIDGNFYVDDALTDRLEELERLAATIIDELDAVVRRGARDPEYDPPRGPRPQGGLAFCAAIVGTRTSSHTANGLPAWPATAQILSYHGWDLGTGSWREKGDRLRKLVDRIVPRPYFPGT